MLDDLEALIFGLEVAVRDARQLLGVAIGLLQTSTRVLDALQERRQ